MSPDDFVTLDNTINRHYLQRPALTVNVVFCFARPRLADHYQKLTKSLSEVWDRLFRGRAEYQCVGVKWGSFMVFVAASNVGSPWSQPTFSDAFALLEERICAGLKRADPSEIVLYRA